jgi:hypothetical protein
MMATPISGGPVSEFDALDNLSRLFSVLIDDLDHYEDHLDGKVSRRAYVRAAFAMIEGLTYGIKQVALDEKFSWSRAELAILTEESYRLTNTGIPETTNASISLLPNIRFAFDALNRSYKAEFKLNVSGPGWQALQRSLKVRHRLMHPKSASDIDVLPAELGDTRTAARWFIANLCLCLKDMVVGLNKQLKTPASDPAHLAQIGKFYGKFKD